MGLSEKEASTKTQMESSSLSQTPKRWQGLKIHLSPSLFSKRQSMGLWAWLALIQIGARTEWSFSYFKSVASLSLPKTVGCGCCCCCRCCCLSSAAFSWIASENPNWNAVHGRFQRWIWLDMHVAHHESLLNTVLVHISIELYIHPFAYKCMCMNNYIILYIYIYMYHYTYNYIYAWYNRHSYKDMFYWYT